MSSGFARVVPGQGHSTRKPPGVEASTAGGWLWMIPAMTDFRARGTIIGLAGLTAVFGMGTGVAPPVWSPENRPAGGQAGRALFRWGRSHTRHSRYGTHEPNSGSLSDRSLASPCGGADGSGWSSCSAVRTGRLRRSRAVHARPIDLVVFQEPSQQCCRKPHLGGGFALRCLQRLSCPDLATRRCP